MNAQLKPAPSPKERPIEMTPFSIGGLLAGRKIQTRRVLDRLLGRFGKVTEFNPSHTHGYDWTFRDKGKRWNEITHQRLLESCPYGVEGNRLWVREVWRVGKCADGFSPAALSERVWKGEKGGIWYDADDYMPANPISPRGRYRHSRFMPRWASRILLELIGVRAEPLQVISEDDAIAEGVKHIYPGAIPGRAARDAYRDVWQQLHGPASWEANPWVWVLTFKVRRT